MHIIFTSSPFNCVCTNSSCQGKTSIKAQFCYFHVILGPSSVPCSLKRQHNNPNRVFWLSTSAGGGGILKLKPHLITDTVE